MQPSWLTTVASTYLNKNIQPTKIVWCACIVANCYGIRHPCEIVRSFSPYYIRSLIVKPDPLTDNTPEKPSSVTGSSIVNHSLESGKTAAPPSSTASTPPTNRTRPLSFPEQVWASLACFRSLQLAIVLLSLLALATKAGVLLPQEGVVDPLEIKRNFGENYRMFKAMGLFNVYSSYWFIALEVLFFLNLLFGSFQWLKPAFLAATRRTFCGPEHIQASPHQLAYTSQAPLGTVTRDVQAWLKKYRYHIHKAPHSQPRRDGSILFYAAKGNFSRLGPVVAHFGILMMLMASVFGVFFGFKAQKLAVPGETFAIRDSQMFKPNVEESLWLGKVPEWKVRVNDFHIQYYEPGESPDQNTVVKQYFADLSVVDLDGHQLKRETISVNHPLSMGSVLIYQASFNPTGKLFISVNGQSRTINTNTTFMNRPVSISELGNGRTLMVFPFFVQQDPSVKRNYAVFFIRDAHGFVGAKPGKMPPNLRLQEGETGTLSGMAFRYIRPQIATGLQIKQGPEVPWMYLSYLIIIVGTVLCIFSQRQLWLAITESKDGQRRELRLMYKSKKARISFMKELRAMEQDLIAHRGFVHWQDDTTQTASRQPGASPSGTLSNGLQGGPPNPDALDAATEADRLLAHR
jgi:cytochrome c biogenesis protein